MLGQEHQISKGNLQTDISVCSTPNFLPRQFKNHVERRRESQMQSLKKKTDKVKFNEISFYFLINLLFTGRGLNIRASWADSVSGEL